MLAKVPWNPSVRQLRQFGFCGLVVLPIVGWFALGKLDPSIWMAGYAVILAIALALGVFAWLHPRLLKPVFLAATLVTLPIGLIVGELVLLLIYFAVFTPVAIFFRLIRRDALERDFDPAGSSYWACKAQPADVQQYFRQS